MNLSFGQIRTSQNPKGNTDVQFNSLKWDLPTKHSANVIIFQPLAQTNRTFLHKAHRPNPRLFVFELPHITMDGLFVSSGCNSTIRYSVTQTRIGVK